MAKLIILVIFWCHLSYTVLSQSFEEECLNKHNEYRALHSTPPLELDEDVQQVAQEWADYLASTGSFQHRPNNQYGENIYGIFGASSIDGSQPVKAWYDEIKDYDWNNPGFTMETGHFTQVIWYNSERLGCAKAQNGTNIYVVANYSPPGNVIGQFPENVLPLEEK